VLLTWLPEGGDFRLVYVLNAFVLAEDFLDPNQAGLTVVPLWERFQP
jgi:hypothetical protein